MVSWRVDPDELSAELVNISSLSEFQQLCSHFLESLSHYGTTDKEKSDLKSLQSYLFQLRPEEMNSPAKESYARSLIQHLWTIFDRTEYHALELMKEPLEGVNPISWRGQSYLPTKLDEVIWENDPFGRELREYTSSVIDLSIVGPLARNGDLRKEICEQDSIWFSIYSEEFDLSELRTITLEMEESISIIREIHEEALSRARKEESKEAIQNQLNWLMEYHERMIARSLQLTPELLAIQELFWEVTLDTPRFEEEEYCEVSPAFLELAELRDELFQEISDAKLEEYLKLTEELVSHPRYSEQVLTGLGAKDRLLKLETIAARENKLRTLQLLRCS